MSLRLAAMECLEATCAPAPTGGCRVVEINDLRTLASYRLAWDALLAQSPHSNYFQTLDWLTIYWQHYGESSRLRVLAVQIGGRTIGFLPLVERTETSKVGSLRVLTYPLHDWGSFYGPIGPNITATLLAAMGHIARCARNWDVLDLRWIDESIADRGRTPRAMQTRGMPACHSIWKETALIDLERAGSWNTYWASRTTKWRTNVRRNEKRLAELGTVRHVRYRPLGSACGDDDPRWDLYEQCEAIARRSWQGGSTNGTTMTHESIRPFLRDSHAAAARAGGVDLNLLYVSDKPIAFNYCYHYHGQVFGLRMGFDRSSGADGAGSVLLRRIIEDSFARGDRMFDLGADYVDCKRPWLTQIAPIGRETYYPPGISRVQLLHAKRWAVDWYRRARGRFATAPPIAPSSLAPS